MFSWMLKHNFSASLGLDGPRFWIVTKSAKSNSREWFQSRDPKTPKEKQEALTALKAFCLCVLRYVVCTANTFSFTYPSFREMVSIIISGYMHSRPAHAHKCRQKRPNRQLVIQLLLRHGSPEELVPTDWLFAYLAQWFFFWYTPLIIGFLSVCLSQ